MSDEEQEQTIAEDLVVTKYKMGGDIANRELIRTSSRWWLEGATCFYGLSCSQLTLVPQQQQQQQPCGFHSGQTYANLTG